jgi:GT2 family glycosyltransferase
MRLMIVIVCYRAAELTIECLRSLAVDIGKIQDACVVVCENGTGGGSAEKISAAIADEGWSDWASVKAIDPNRGFAGGNNVILREAMASETRPEFFLLLNADTIVRPGALVELMKAVEDHAEAGIVCPRLEWPDGEPQISCFRFHTPVSEMLAAARTGHLTKTFSRWLVPIPVSDVPFEPQWASFACALIRSRVMEEIGLLDEGYYLYFDDVDFCRSARDAGWGVLYWPQARVVHLRGQSNPVKSLGAARKRRPRYFYASRSWYFAKFYGVGGLWLTNVLWTLGRLMSLAREVLGLKEPHVCEREWLDIWTKALSPMRREH